MLLMQQHHADGPPTCVQLDIVPQAPEASFKIQIEAPCMLWCKAMTGRSRMLALAG